MRYPSIDLLRALAIVLMVTVHFLENLAGVDWAPAGLGAPLFAFLAGVSFRLWVRAQEAKGVPDGAITRTAARRGLFLFALGVAFNVLVWLPPDTFNWDVLTMIGTALAALAFARHLPAGVLAVIAAVVFALAPVLRSQADYLSYWANDYFECDLTLNDVFVGYLSAGYFPLFPWAAFPFAGYLAGRVVFPEFTEVDPPSVRPLVVAGGGGVLLAALCRLGQHTLPDPVPTALLTGWTMFPASPEYVCGTLGFALLAFAALHVWVDRQTVPAGVGRVLSAAGVMGRYSLSIYLLHHALHLWPLWVYGAMTGDDPTHYWRQAMPVWAAVALVPPGLLACHLYAATAERWRWPTVESVMRWVCD